MKSINTIKIYEVNGKETGISSGLELEVKNHSIRKDFVVIKTSSSEEITISAEELRKAVRNAQNV